MSALPRILLLDDDVAVLRGVEFRLRGFAEVVGCRAAPEALALIRQHAFDAALIDVNLGPGQSGIEAVAELRAIDPDLAPVIFTAHSDYETAIAALRVHAFNFVPKSLRQDEEFRIKLTEAIAHTRARRAIARHAGDASKLRAELQEAIVRQEIEITNSQIQRGLLAESLESFSALLGRVELLDHQLQQRLADAPDLADLAGLAGGTLDELNDYVGGLRDYFAAPERAAASVNGLLERAAVLLREELPAGCSVEVRPLASDLPVAGEARALLRAVVVLTRLAAGAAAEGVLSLVPSVLVNPVQAIEGMKQRPGARVLFTPEFRRDDRRAFAIAIGGPGRGLDLDGLAALLSADSARNAAGPWAVLAMLSRAGGALAIEVGGGDGVLFTIVGRL